MMGPFSKILYLRNKAGAFRQGDQIGITIMRRGVDLRTVPPKIVETDMDTMTAMGCWNALKAVPLCDYHLCSVFSIINVYLKCKEKIL